MEDLVLNENSKIKKNNKKGLANDDGPNHGDNCLQNLKSIARIAFDEIRKQKITGYQSIATSLLLEISKEYAGYEDSPFVKN